MRITALSLILLAALVIGVSAPALALDSGWLNAAPVSVPVTLNDWSQNFVFTQFNGGSTYILSRVDWDFAGAVSGSAGYENTDGQPQSIILSLSTTLSWTGPAGGTFVSYADNNIVQFNIANPPGIPAFDGTLNYAGTSGATSTSASIPHTGTGFLVSGADFDAFKGTGTVTTVGASKGVELQSVPTPVNTVYSSNGTMTPRIKYTYSLNNSVPEPGTTALFLVGLAAMGVIRRRRQAAA
jgi:hypothetical protein